MIYKDLIIKSSGKKHKIQVTNNSLFEKQEIPVSLDYLNNYFDCISAILRKKCIIKLKKIPIEQNRIQEKLSNNIKSPTNKTNTTYSKFLDESENSDDNKLKCLLCKKKFKDKFILKKHAIVHTNERPYKCTICSVAFKKKYTLVQHERTHSGEKPFSCSNCNMKFSRKAYLETHQFHHYDSRFFKCEICNKILSTRGILRRHINTVHEKKTQCSCSVCGNTFTRRYDLKIHLENIHLRNYRK